jgi:hypothetical protein
VSLDAVPGLLNPDPGSFLNTNADTHFRPDQGGDHNRFPAQGLGSGRRQEKPDEYGLPSELPKRLARTLTSRMAVVAGDLKRCGCPPQTSSDNPARTQGLFHVIDGTAVLQVRATTAITLLMLKAQTGQAKVDVQRCGPTALFMDMPMKRRSGW